MGSYPEHLQPGFKPWMATHRSANLDKPHFSSFLVDRKHDLHKEFNHCHEGARVFLLKALFQGLFQREAEGKNDDFPGSLSRRNGSIPGQRFLRVRTSNISGSIPFVQIQVQFFRVTSWGGTSVNTRPDMCFGLPKHQVSSPCLFHWNKANHSSGGWKPLNK